MDPKALQAALRYIESWLAFQLRVLERPGLTLAVTHRQRIVLELGLGEADILKKTPMTAQHQLRIASHSKTFTAVGILKLREQGLLGLDDPAGRHVKGLHADVAKVRLSQLLSHSAGVSRDGPDAGQFQDRHPYLDREQLLQDLARGLAITPNTRFKYSNHGFGLLGLVIEAVTGQRYVDWMAREVVAPAGLEHTLPDRLPGKRTGLAAGHSGRLLLGRRVVIPGDNETRAIAPAGGFVSTAGDVARFYAQLLPTAKKSLLSVDSRRELMRRHAQVPHSSTPSWYGLGVMHGSYQGWDWLGHTGGLQGFVSRSLVLPQQEIAISLLANSLDAFTWPWVDGILQVLQTFDRHGAPTARTRDWTGRWWNLWGATDLVPMGDHVLAVGPALAAPFTDATQLTPTGKDRAVMSQANGYATFGEEVRRVRDAKGQVKELWLGGSLSRPENVVAREMQRRYEG